MLHVRLICVGKLKEKFYREACAEYEKRLKGYCKLEIIELTEQRLPDSPSQAQIDAALAKEAEAIRAKIPAGSAVVAMCIEGGTLSSEQFADKLSKWMGNGVSHISVLIGGSCGLDESRAAAAVHVTDDVSASFGARDGAGTAVSGAQYRIRRKIS